MGEYWDKIMTLFTSGSAMLLIIFILLLITTIGLIPVIGKWRVYEKAGQPGWAIFIPYYNDYALVRIAGLPWWCFPIKLLINFLIPQSDNVIAVVLSVLVAKGFGKTLAFGVGLGFFPFVFYPILGLGNAQYLHPTYLVFNKLKFPFRQISTSPNIGQISRQTQDQGLSAPSIPAVSAGPDDRLQKPGWPISESSKTPFHQGTQTEYIMIG